MKALVVEDHPDMLEILGTQLETLGFGVILARNGKEGMEKAIEEKPHVIFMDIMMPGMDGLEATRMIRSNPRTKDITILATTALFRPSDVQACIEAGCNDYLVKPFRFEALKEKVQGICS